MSDQALVLFAHGARDPRWAEPFGAVVARVKARAPELPVVLAFLEHLSPDLMTAVRTLAGQKVLHVTIVPLFFGRGGHLRKDFPALLARVVAAVPEVRIDIAVAAGESGTIQEALAAFALGAMK